MPFVRKKIEISEYLKEEMFRLARSYGDLSDKMYQPGRLSGTDAVDALRWSLTAAMFRGLGEGKPIKTVTDKCRKEWCEFCVVQQKKVNEAPKIKRGPSAEHSVIDYKWASEHSIDANIIYVTNAYNSTKKSDKSNK